VKFTERGILSLDKEFSQDLLLFPDRIDGEDVDGQLPEFERFPDEGTEDGHLKGLKWTGKVTKKCLIPGFIP
jgi:hypothetical protein